MNIQKIEEKTSFLASFKIILVNRVWIRILDFACSTYLVAKLLPEKDFGIFSYVISCFFICYQLMSLGISTTYAKFFHENNGSSRFFLNFFLFRFVTGFFFSILFWISFGLLHNSFYLYFIVMFNLLGAILTDFFVQHYQIQERFKISVQISSACQYVRCTCFILCFANGWFTIEALLWGYFIGYTFTALVLVIKIVPKEFINYRKTTDLKLLFSKLQMTKYIKYGVWLTLSSLLVVIILYLDGIMLFHMQGPVVSAAYALAFRFVEPILLLSDAMSKVFMPRLFKENTIENIKEYLSKLNRYLMPVAILITIVGLIIIDPIFEYFFHNQYVLTPNIIKVLIPTVSISIYSIPHSLILYQIEKPHLFTISHGFQLFGIIILNFWMIPKYGAMGAAWNTLFIKLIIVTFYFTYIRKYISKQDAKRNQVESF